MDEEDDFEDEFEDDDEDEEMRRLQKMVGIETGEIEQAGGDEDGEDDEDEFEDALQGEQLLTSSHAEIGRNTKGRKKIEGIQKVRATKAECMTAALVHKVNLMCLLVRGMQNRCVQSRIRLCSWVGLSPSRIAILSIGLSIFHGVVQSMVQ
jgi:hypothetical protein